MLPGIAARRLRELRASQQQSCIDRPGLIDYVEAQLPGWQRFDYFAPYAKALEGAVGAELRLCFAAPPQHGKTVFTLRGLLYWCEFFPGFRHAYITYNQQRAREVADEFRILAREAGLEVTGNLSRYKIRNAAGVESTIRFSSVKGSLTGYAIDGVCIIDDFIKDQESARSKANREAGVRWWESVARTRRHKGTSFVVMATRWPGGDLTDHLLKSGDFSYINLKAIAEPEHPEDVDPVSQIVLSDPLRRRIGESLSKLKPPEFFREDRAKPFWWAAMFQGSPRPEGMAVFASPGAFDDQGQPIGAGYYRELPKEGYRVAYGVDLAYSQKTSSDWSVCVEGWATKDKLYIVDVQRKQVPATSFLLTLVAARTNRPGAVFRFYSGGGGEKGVADFIRQKLGRCFKVIPATADKMARATASSVSWNLGHILLPDPAHIKAPWLDDFLAIVTSFTGTPGEQDDDVDALAALHDQLMHRRSRQLGTAEKARAAQ